MLAPAYQLAALSRMESTFEAIQELERSMALALQIEDAVHEQYEHGARLVVDGEGEARDAAFEEARRRALELTHTLTRRMSEADAAAWEKQISEGTAELGRLFRAQVAPAAGPSTATTLAHDPGYAVVLLIEKSIHEYFGEIQQATSQSRRELVRIEQGMLRWTLVLLAATTAFVAAMVLYVSSSIASPLAKLSEGAAAVAAGDLNARIRIRRPDEFGALAAEFNAMTVALRKHQRRTAEAEKLAGIGRVAAGVAHEINNPLQVVLGYLSLNRDIEDPERADQLAAAEAEVLRCKAIVDGMLDLSRPRQRTVTRVDLRELCEDVASSLRLVAQPGAPRLTVDGSAHVRGDRARLRQLVFNLMKNATEAAGAGGWVAVAIRSEEAGAEIAVSDSGSGLTSEALSRVFEPFFTTKPDGTGLGLAVSRAIARSHGGDVDVRNGDAAGAVFTLRLPRAVKGVSTWTDHAFSSRRIGRASSSS